MQVGMTVRMHGALGTGHENIRSLHKWECRHERQGGCWRRWVRGVVWQGSAHGVVVIFGPRKGGEI